MHWNAVLFGIAEDGLILVAVVFQRAILRLRREMELLGLTCERYSLSEVSSLPNPTR
jgi:hypothetical protein